ncbi:hypothetical protein MBUL_03902 [Methylobacterium bullatum]|uniref:DUF2721 domain-containing protein n=1 Tax=Methylobacterium bullatum TaxID=570505 RepID=A0A679J3H5_9HYPH|nr:hypothetical protein MBUL_03902 [Methylobacterium bullatum]
MATYGDFSSLLQLGVGIGIGLSLFRAPVDLRVSKLTRTMDNELTALRGASMPFAKVKWRDVQQLRYRFAQVRLTLERQQLRFMVIALALALLNLVALVEATLDKDRPACGVELYGLLFVAIGGFVALLSVLEVLARYHLGPIQRELQLIQARRAPPAGAALAYGP